MELVKQDLINLIYDNPAEELEDNLKVYSNPFYGDKIEYSIVFDEEQDFTLSLYNTSGQLLAQEKRQVKQPGINHFELSVPKMKSGVYFLSIETQKGVACRKEVKL